MRGNVFVLSSMVRRRKSICHMQVNTSTSFLVCFKFFYYYILLVIDDINVVSGIIPMVSMSDSSPDVLRQVYVI